MSSPRPLLARTLLVLAALSLPALPAGAQTRSDPPLDALLDSAALLADARALDLQAAGVMPLFRITFDEQGGVDRVEAVFDQIPAAYAAPVVAALRARARAQAPSQRPRGTTLRIVTGAEARVDRPTLRETQPELANRARVSGMLGRVYSRDPVRSLMIPGRAYTMLLRFQVRPDGAVEDSTVMVIQAAQEEELNRAAVAVVQSMRFRAATIEGLPVRVWVQLPVTFRLPEPPPAGDPAAPRRP
jgi:TonB family protein